MLIFDQLRKNDPPLRALSLAVLVAMGVLTVGLWFVQIVCARRFQASLETQSFRTVRIPAIRGKICDRNGVALADNQPSYEVNVYLEELRPKFGEAFDRLRPMREAKNAGPFWKRWAGLGDTRTIPAKLTAPQRQALNEQVRYSVVSNIAHRLATELGQPVSLDPEAFKKHYDQKRSLPLTLTGGLTPEQIALYWERRHHWAGLGLDVQPARVYPFGTTAAHLLGHLQRHDVSKNDLHATYDYRLPDVKGIVGVEGAFDEELRGTAGVKSVLVNNLGYRQSETIWAPAEPGNNVYLTIDVGLQQVAEKALRSVYGAETRGAVVVMDPQTGDVLALASAPAFDPNHFPGISQQEYERLNDPNVRAFYNRATQGYLAPGSIFKIITGLACLEAGTLDPAEKLNNPGFYRVSNNVSIDDTAPPGDYDFKRAFVHSSNTYFAHHGVRLGGARLVEMGNRFLLGERTGIPTLQDGGGYFPKADDVARGWFDGDTANLSIGQGRIAVSPLQMAVVTSAIVNGGKLLWPRLVDRIEPMDPASSRAPRHLPRGRVRGELNVNPRNLEIIRQAMIADVEAGDGTGRRSAVPGLVIGGKTGTAENKRGRMLISKTTWFVSWAATSPQSPAQYVVVVMVEKGASGSLTCAPVAQKIYQEIKRREDATRARGATVAHVR